MFPYYGFAKQSDNELVSEIAESVWAAGGSMLDKKIRLANKLELMVLGDQLSKHTIKRITNNEWVHARLNGYAPKMIEPEELVSNGGILGK